MRLLALYRKRDISGVSGTGYVAQGVEFDNGKCALAWLGDVSSVTIYDSIEDLERIHCHGGLSVVRVFTICDIDQMMRCLV